MLGIQVVSRAGATLDEPVSAVFGDAGGAIGRGADCTLILADPERRISRKQLLILARDGRHFIRQISASVVVELNGVPLVPNVDYALDSGTQVRIGPYLLRTVAADAEPSAIAVHVAPAAAAAPVAPVAPVAPAAQVAPVAPPAPVSPLAPSATAVPAPSPAATQLRRAASPPAAADGHAVKPVAPTTPMTRVASAAPAARAAPAPAPAPAPAQTPRPAQRMSPPGLPASLRAAPRPSLDDLMEGFGLGTRGARSSVFGNVLDEPPAPAGFRSSRGPEPGVPLPTLVPETSSIDLLVGDPTYAGPRPAAAAAAPAPSGEPLAAPNNAPPAQGALTAEALAALYEGLGMPRPGTPEGTTAQLKLIGGLLRGAVEGTLALLAARMIAKRELGANATLLQTRENNPLKFSPDADVALGHLLGPAQRGFIAPLAAVNDAFNDLRAHEVAVLAGMRAALDEVLSRFDPQALEQRFAPKAMWDSLLPMNRKANLWEAYAAHHAEILREIEGDFDSLFGRAFLKAYQAQLAQLAQPPASDTP